MTDKSTFYLARKSAISLSGHGVGAATGIILDATILAIFGVGMQTDALFAALALPAVFADTLEVQLPKVLVPILLSSAAQRGSVETDQLLLSIGLLMMSLFALMALAGTWCASWLVAVQVPGFAPQTQQITASLAGLLFWLMPFRGLAAVLQSGLLARHSYAAPSFAKPISQLATLSWFLPNVGSLAIRDVGIGFLVGAAASVLFQMAILLYQGFSRTLPRRRDLWSAWNGLKLLPVPLISQGLGEGTLLLENWLTSFLPPGVLSSLRYATRIATATGGIIVGSVVRAALPLLSAAVASRDRSEVSRRLEEALRLVLLLGGVIFVLLVFCGQPLIALLFARGRFGAAETAAVSLLVVLFIPSVVLGRVLGVIQLPFYANQKMLPILSASLVALGGYTLIGPPALWAAGVYGLPVARLAVLSGAVVVTYRLARAQFDIRLRWNWILALPLRVTLQFGAACLIGLTIVLVVPFEFFHTDFGRLLGPFLIGAMGLLASLTSALAIRNVRQLPAVLVPVETIGKGKGIDHR